MDSEKLYRNYILHFTFLLFVIFTTSGCNFSSSSGPDIRFPDASSAQSDWLVDTNEVIDGGPGVDGIPSIDHPDFTIASEVNFLDDNRRIAGIRIGDDVRAYAHQILDQHEIVNDTFDGKSVAVTFCPLTGTSIGVNRDLGGNRNNVEFGVSGLLFRNNLIMYDRETNSLWSQMRLRSINGEMMGANSDVVQLVETTWGTWRKMYPDSKVLNTNTGFNRNYNIHVYGRDYTTNDLRILFPILNEDPRLNRKDRVHALIPNNADESSRVKAFYINDFGNETKIVKDYFSISEDTALMQEFLIVGNNHLDLINAFRLTSQFEKELELAPLADESLLPAVMSDQHGNHWDIFGYAIIGPHKGTQLTEARSYTGYWYALADFYPNIELYAGE